MVSKSEKEVGFRICGDFLRETLALLLEMPQYAVDVHSLLTSENINKPVFDDYEDYTCQICSCIIKDPMICKSRQCSRLIDRKCLQIWEVKCQTKNLPVVCPNCNSSEGYDE